MGLTATAGKQIDPVPEALHLAVCYLVADLGTHTEERWGKEIHKAIIGWELPNERMQVERDGEMKELPRAISQRYTLSLHKKANLRHDLETWRGKAFSIDELEGFDLKHILGAPCQLQVMHNKSDDGRIFANVSAVMPWPDKMAVSTPENPLQWFSFEEGSELPENVPEWITDIIKASHEWQALTAGAIGADDPDIGPDLPHDDDNLPF